jgi:hypothetical protein
VPLKEILLGIKCVIPRPPRFLRGPYPSHKVRPLCVGVYLFVPPGFFTPHSPDLSLGGAPRGNGHLFAAYCVLHSVQSTLELYFMNPHKDAFVGNT